MPFKDPEVRLLFPVPFITIRLDDSETLNRRLLKEIGKRRRTEPGMVRSNRYGWHSAPTCSTGPSPRTRSWLARSTRWSRPVR